MWVLVLAFWVGRVGKRSRPKDEWPDPRDRERWALRPFLQFCGKWGWLVYFSPKCVIRIAGSPSSSIHHTTIFILHFSFAQSNPQNSLKRFFLHCQASIFLLRSKLFSFSSQERPPHYPIFFENFENPDYSFVFLGLISEAPKLPYPMVSPMLQTAFNSVLVYLIFENHF